jgi:DNA topoisomerase I
MTTLERLQQSGIRRLGTPARGFRYKRVDGKRLTAADRKRIDALKIPPACIDVCINPGSSGTVQVIGKDAAGRLQYLYHEKHVRKREVKKFKRLIKFGEALPQLRSSIASHLRQPGLGRERVLATILRILSMSFLRPGSQVYASENGSFGIATLKPKHVKVKGDVVEFDFPGKSGVQQVRMVKDHAVAKVVRTLLKVPSREVFKYQNGDGQFVDVKRRHINEYIREVMGEAFSAKDFRTWAGTLTCASALARANAEPAANERARKRQIVQAIKETADVLGNTPAVCRSSYVCPEVINNFETGQCIKKYFGSLNELTRYRGRKHHPAEKSLLTFMKRAGK